MLKEWFGLRKGRAQLFSSGDALLSVQAVQKGSGECSQARNGPTSMDGACSAIPSLAPAPGAAIGRVFG